MNIESIKIENFTSIKNETLNVDDLTILVGPNGAGKSSFLKAINIFYDKYVPQKDDFYDNDTNKEIIVAVTFKELPAKAIELFEKYIEGGKLTVEKVIKFDASNGKISGTYHGSKLQNPDFDIIRNQTKAGDQKVAYESLKSTNAKYSSLGKWTKQEEGHKILKEWEEKNQNECKRQRDDGRFFGFTSVAQGYLGRFTKILHLPAVLNADDISKDNKGSIIGDLMEMVVRSEITKKPEFKSFFESTQKSYKEILSEDKLPELASLKTKIEKTLQTFVPNSGIDCNWNELNDLEVPLPTAKIKIVEDGYKSPVTNVGHGLQRAYILSLLQCLAAAQDEKSASEVAAGQTSYIPPKYFLTLEEPEIYQHPDRQRSIAKTLQQLSSGKIAGVVDKMQILYCTHSPLFVSVDKIENIRLLRKTADEKGKPKISKIIFTNLSIIANELRTITGKTEKDCNEKTLLPRLHSIMTPWMNEGFFSKVVVLVEGEDDRAAILGVAKSMNHDFEALGISVIPCGGKANIDRPYLIFKRLGIPIFIVWDSDYADKNPEICKECKKPKGKQPNPEPNKLLLKMLGKKEEDWPETVENDYACFKCDLECTLRSEIGERVFTDILQECREEFSFTEEKHALKNPNIISEIVKRAKAKENSSKTMEEIVKKINEKLK